MTMNQAEATAKETLVEFDNVVKEFTKTGSVFRAIDGLSISIQRGERVAIVGETGSGKSTALALLLGLQRPTSGNVRVLGIDPFAEFGALSGRLGIIFQSDRLLPWRTALQNAAYGLQVLKKPRPEREEIARQWLDRLGLAAFVDAYPHELSGGMKQRVAIARTMAISPQVLVADEAFSALDEMTASSVRADLLAVLANVETTTIFVTHSVAESVELADRVLVFARPGLIVDEVRVTDMRSRGIPASEIQERVRHGLRTSQPTAAFPAATPSDLEEPLREPAS
ncbi:ATP-binding cassette domain-containing protein [Arthrobacter pascens]|nr:ATP-binding cassette domain-containing protein [Arthrobacter pascens]